MDPETYRHFGERFMGTLPPFIPINEQQQENSAQHISRDPGWTVHNPDVMRGNLENTRQDETDPRTSVGWTSPKPKSWHLPTSPPQPFMWSGGYVEKDDEATPRASEQTQYPHADLSLPHPSLHLDFRMSVTLNPRISVGSTPFGHRNWISFTGGNWSGCWGSGIVLPGGQDSQLIIADGSARLETNYILETLDSPPAHIVIKTHGWRTGPPDILAKLADPEQADSVDPSSYKFRLFIEMETGDERYSEKVNCGMWVGSGMRKGAEVIYDAYRVL